MAINSVRDGARIAHLLDQIERSLEDPELVRLHGVDDAADLDPAFLLGVTDLETERGRAIFAAARDLAAVDPDAGIDFDADLRVEIDDDAMTATAILAPAIGSGQPMTLSRARTLLEDVHGVRHGIDEAALDRALATPSSLPCSFVAARGTPPVPGRGERWEVVEVGRDPVVEGADGRVDYRDLPATRAIHAGDLLATRIPAVPGTPGRDVLGRAIAPSPAVPEEPMTAGRGAEPCPEGIRATAEGELSVEGRRVSVVPVRTVIGDVDYATGNIDFPGNVVIHGSVLEGFTVRSSGDIEIAGTVTAACIQAAGTIRVGGGIICRDRGLVAAGGDVTARFIENSRVKACGAVRVRRSILHSKVDAVGDVEVMGDPGGIVGGRVRSGGTVVCRMLGNEFGTRTVIHFGEDYRVVDRLREIERAIVTLRDRLQEVDATLAPLARPSPGTPMASNHDALLARTEAVRARILAEIQALLKSRTLVLAESGRTPGGEVRVLGDTNAGVQFSSRGVDRVVETVHKRTRFRLRGKKIEVCPYD